MRLLICASEYYPSGSGIANVAYDIVEEMKKNGIICTVCSPTGPDIKLGSSKLIQKFGIIGLLYYWFQVSKYFNDKDSVFDVVWCHNPLFLSKNPFSCSIMTMHSTYFGEFLRGMFPPHLRLYKKIASIIEKYCLLRLKLDVIFTAVSPGVCDELNKIGIKKQKVVYISNGVNINSFKPTNDKKIIREKYGISSDNLVLLSVGRLTEVKNPLKMIEIFSLIEKEIKNISLVIVGDGELLSQAKEYAVMKKLNNVFFLGHLDYKKNVPDLYSCSDFYVMASKYEGQPLTLLEAMSSGLPCIVSDIPNLDIVADAKCGIIVNFSDPNIAAQNIVKYLKENHSIQRSNSRKYIESNFDWSIIANKYLKEFVSLGSSKTHD